METQEGYKGQFKALFKALFKTLFKASQFFSVIEISVWVHFFHLFYNFVSF